VPAGPGMTILEGLQYIREHLDATLAWRFSCRMGICGSCAVVINGRSGLACNTQILDISDSEIRLEPLANFPVIRDLVPDLGSMFDKHVRLRPYLIRADQDEIDASLGEFEQSPEQLLEFNQFSYCIKCGACMSACPTMAQDAAFFGPMPLTAAHRYNSDSRDQGFAERGRALDTGHAAAHCHYAGECSRVCPKGVDPGRAIQLMKRSLVMELLRLRKSADRTRLIEPPVAQNVDDESLRPPPFTAKHT